jgi:ABC-2 type transport system ATP-binding protein
MSIQRCRLAAAVMLAASSFCCLSGTAKAAPPLTGGGPALAATNYDVTVTSFDGTQIAVTVWVPKSPANTPVPLVVHSNAWAGHRMSTLDPKGLVDKIFYSQSEEAAKLAYQNGYFLVTYDERGWGDSGGTDEMMNAGYNGKDFVAVLNWADAHLGPQVARRNGKLVVGTLGYSYGGGFQLLGASLDSRVAVMVPALTWNSFVTSLGPGQPTYQPRTQWAKLLRLTGQLFGKKMNPVLLDAVPDIARNGDAATSIPTLFALAASNGPNAYCDAAYTPAPGQHRPAVPTYLVQGWQDTLFNAREAYATAECLRQTGADVRVLIQQYGHTIPGQGDFPAEDGTIAVAMEENPHCGGLRSFSLPEAMYSFIDENIRGTARSGPHVDIPANCVTVDDDNGFTLPILPTTDSITYTVASQTVSGTGKSATFVPLYRALTGHSLAGIPHMKVTVSSTSGTPWAYFGIGIKRAGGSPQLLDQQLYPIHGSGTFETDMVPVSMRLSPGDQVGIYASNVEKQFAYKKQPKTMPVYQFSGTFNLPQFID